MSGNSAKPGLGVLQLLNAWRSILTGSAPMLSIEITREGPLSCPGCYAYGDDHLGGDVTLRGLADALAGDLDLRLRAHAGRHCRATLRRRPAPDAVP